MLRQVGTVPGLAKVLDRLDLGDAPSRGEAAAGVEFVLEGLHLTRRHVQGARPPRAGPLYGSRRD